MELSGRFFASEHPNGPHRLAAEGPLWIVGLLIEPVPALPEPGLLSLGRTQPEPHSA
jgi:hypothetical protein